MASLHRLIGTADTGGEDFDQDLPLDWFLELDILKCEGLVGFLEDCRPVSLWESGHHGDSLFDQVF